MKIRHSEAANRANRWTGVGGRILVVCGVLLGIGALAVPASGKSSGIAGKAGAPGDPGPGQSRTCYQCHAPAPFVPVEGTLSIDVPEEVDGGDLVDVTVSFDGDGFTRWGFNLIAVVDEEDGLPTGTLVAGAGSQIKTSGALWEYLSHTFAGTTSLVNEVDPGWEVQWQAPAQGVESVRFYAAFNAANFGGTGGDTIFTAETTVSVIPEPSPEEIRCVEDLAVANTQDLACRLRFSARGLSRRLQLDDSRCTARLARSLARANRRLAGCAGPGEAEARATANRESIDGRIEAIGSSDSRQAVRMCLAPRVRALASHFSCGTRLIRRGGSALPGEAGRERCDRMLVKKWDRVDSRDIRECATSATPAAVIDASWEAITGSTDEEPEP